MVFNYLARHIPKSKKDKQADPVPQPESPPIARTEDPTPSQPVPSPQALTAENVSKLDKEQSPRPADEDSRFLATVFSSLGGDRIEKFAATLESLSDAGSDTPPPLPPRPGADTDTVVDAEPSRFRSLFSFLKSDKPDKPEQPDKRDKLGDSDSTDSKPDSKPDSKDNEPDKADTPSPDMPRRSESRRSSSARPSSYASSRQPRQTPVQPPMHIVPPNGSQPVYDRHYAASAMPATMAQAYPSATLPAGAAYPAAATPTLAHQRPPHSPYGKENAPRGRKPVMDPRLYSPSSDYQDAVALVSSDQPITAAADLDDGDDKKKKKKNLTKLSTESSKLLKEFGLILKDIGRGAPAAYGDLERLLVNNGSHIESIFDKMPPRMQKAAKTLSKNMSKNPSHIPPRSDKPKEGGLPGILKFLDTGLLLSLLSKLKVPPLPAAALTPAALASFGLFVLLCALYYCFKRGRELRLTGETDRLGQDFQDTLSIHSYDGPPGVPPMIVAPGQPTYAVYPSPDQQPLAHGGPIGYAAYPEFLHPTDPTRHRDYRDHRPSTSRSYDVESRSSRHRHPDDRRSVDYDRERERERDRDRDRHSRRSHRHRDDRDRDRERDRDHDRDRERARERERDHYSRPSHESERRSRRVK